VLALAVADVFASGQAKSRATDPMQMLAVVLVFGDLDDSIRRAVSEGSATKQRNARAAFLGLARRLDFGLGA